MNAVVADLSVVVGADIKNLQSNLNKANSDVTSFGDRTKKAMGSIRQVAIPAGLAAVGIGAGALKAAIDFEYAFSDVRKTVNGTEDDLNALSEAIRNMATEGDLASLENAHETLTGIAAIGGQLGVPIGDLQQFTKVIGAMTVATNLSADSAAEFVARFANVTGMPLAEIENFADALVTLGNNSAASEADIASVANRLATLASFKFNVSDILGLSAAVASLGLNPELAGTNILKFVSDMTKAASVGGKDLQAFASAAGMTASAFGEMVKNDPSGAFMNLLEALSTMSIDDQLSTLEELGVTSSEQQRVIMTLAAGYDTVEDSVTMANEAFKGNGALMTELGAKAETTQGQMNKLQNNIRELAISGGELLIPFANKATEALTKLFQGLNEGNSVKSSQGLLDLLQTLTDFTGVDIGTGLASWISAIWEFGKIVEIVTNDVARRFEMMVLDLTISAGELIKSITSIVPQELLPQGFAMDLDSRLMDAETQRYAYEAVDRINDHIRDVMESGEPISLFDMIEVDGQQGMLIEMLKGLDMQGLLTDTTVSELTKLNLGDWFAQSIASGDVGTTLTLLNFSDYFSFDLGELESSLGIAMQTALQTQDLEMAQMIYEVALQLNPNIDFVGFNQQLTALINGQRVSAVVNADIKVNANVTAVSGLNSGGAALAGRTEIPVFHGGGVFQSPTGEGLAMLQSGERVLTPSQTKAYEQGGGVVINYSSFGETPYNALRKLQKSARDAGY